MKPSDLLPQPPWEGPPIPKGLSNRIRRMTEHEIIHALCAGSITPSEVYTTFGDCALSRGVVEKYEEYKSVCENPALYWDVRINRLKEQIRELEEKKRRQEQPPMPYSF